MPVNLKDVVWPELKNENRHFYSNDSQGHHEWVQACSENRGIKACQSAVKAAEHKPIFFDDGSAMCSNECEICNPKPADRDIEKQKELMEYGQKSFINREIDVGVIERVLNSGDNIVWDSESNVTINRQLAEAIKKELDKTTGKLEANP